MSNAHFGDNATLYRKARVNGAEIYARYELRGVQWRQKIVREASEGGRYSVRTATSVTIPADTIGADMFPGPMQGDVLVHGSGPQLTEAYTIADLRRESPSYCTVQAVADNTLRPRLKHWRIEAV